MTGWAVDVDMSERLLEVEVFKDNEGNKQRCYVPCESSSSVWVPRRVLGTVG